MEKWEEKGEMGKNRIHGNGKDSKDRDKEVGRKNAGCQKTETKLFAGLMSEPK